MTYIDTLGQQAKVAGRQIAKLSTAAKNDLLNQGHPVSGLLLLTLALLRLGFPTAPHLKCLTLPVSVTRRTVLQKVLKVLKEMDELSTKIMNEHKNLNLYIILGQGIYYGVANECMNKMKEMGLSNSEGYYDLEYRHGPMSLVDENTLIVCLSNKACRDGDKALMEQMKSYGATVAVLGGELGDTFDQIADYVYSMDKGWNDMQYSAIIGFIGQLLGYYIADSKNLDADSPRHLTQAIVLK